MRYLSDELLRLGIFLVVLCTFSGFSGCSGAKERSLSQIIESGKITVITDNNAHCYYIYKEQAVGFEYDLAKAFAASLGVELEVITPGWDDMFKELDRGKGDFIASSLTVTADREKIVDFSDEYLPVQQHVIIHRGNREISKLEDLDGQTVHVRKNTSYQERLLELIEEGLEVRLVLHKNVPTEELIRQVAEKEIEITVADTNVALLNRRYYPSVRIAFPIEEKQSLGWAVRKGNGELLREINRFFAAIEEDGKFGRIYERYYVGAEIFDYVDIRKLHRTIETELPKYERIIKREARKYGFNWHLIAATIYQESHFNPRAKSYTGVRGLMQITLPTAKEMGIEDRLDPEQSIRAGVRYLHKLYERFDDIEGFDRMLFTLAAYNVGYGHMRDAQKIARQNGLKPHKWSSLKKSLPLLRYRKYYSKTKYGYARGTEPVRYVDRILNYYDVVRRMTRA
ncbi:MAG: membrane-bound lytic murein transglycosylase MltF [Deltaproteobacteria bacterium]|nr:MAG: membrane-bound lytic murein transglycosylase MltF [Deltaproteobacteria bacterium]